MNLLDTMLKRTDEEERIVSALLSADLAEFVRALDITGAELLQAHVPRDLYHWLPVLERMNSIIENDSADDENVLAVLKFLKILFDLGYHKLHFLHIEVRFPHRILAINTLF